VREIRSPGSVEGVMSNHDPYSDSVEWIDSKIPGENLFTHVDLRVLCDAARTPRRNQRAEILAN